MSEGAQEVSATADPVLAFWHAPLEFAVHAVVGVFCFATIAGAAALLEVGLRWLETHGIGSVITFGLKVAEYGLFTTDLVLFAVFLWRTARRTVQNL
ncbi:MAG: hypothetical protein EXQ52_04940 [Bryobacterales bacterium]|nr:hypothetical protein [Bryobacterales bacterium]